MLFLTLVSKWSPPLVEASVSGFSELSLSPAHSPSTHRLDSDLKMHKQ